MLEYGLVTPDEEKHSRGFYFSSKGSITKQTKNNFITKLSKSLHHKLQHNIQSYIVIKTKTVR